MFSSLLGSILVFVFGPGVSVRGFAGQNPILSFGPEAPPVMISTFSVRKTVLLLLEFCSQRVANSVKCLSFWYMLPTVVKISLFQTQVPYLRR